MSAQKEGTKRIPPDREIGRETEVRKKFRKKLQKTFEKPLDKRKRKWYNKWAVAKKRHRMARWDTGQAEETESAALIFEN